MSPYRVYRKSTFIRRGRIVQQQMTVPTENFDSKYNHLNSYLSQDNDKCQMVKKNYFIVLLKLSW